MMKDLKEYIRESILDDIDYQIENTDEIIKNSTTRWIKDNVKLIQENKLEFDFNTSPVTVNYDGDIQFKTNITALTNGAFQWGEVRGYFDCYNCDSLTSLEGSPIKVGGNFYCGGCKSLKSLKDAPKEVGWDFYCTACKGLKSLEGAPKKVGVNFDCSNCYLLESLEGAPKEVGGDFDCSNCKSLKSLEGAPKEVRYNFYCYGCHTKFTEDDVKKICNVRGKIHCK